jgi:putative addiction module killer protein
MRDSLPPLKRNSRKRSRSTKPPRTVWVGDCKPVGAGVSELRVDYWPGYRIYFGQKGQTLVILLCGADKRTQEWDIRQAQPYRGDYQQRERT